MIMARVWSVRPARRVIHRAATAKISAAGMSQAICPPITPSNIRVMPVLPHWPVPTLPVSLPVRRPKPL